MKKYIILLLKQVIKILYIFPIDNKLITAVSFHGDSYACSPKYITEYILKYYPDYKIVWAFNRPDKFIDIVPFATKCIKYKSIKYIYYAVKSAVRINNAEEWIVLDRRNGQKVINTWHAGCSYKKVGRAATLVNKDLAYNDYYNISNLFLSGSRENTELVFRNSFLYTGKIFEKGIPRNDILVNINETITHFFKKKYNVEHKKVVLYAPTFREFNTKIEPIRFNNLKVNLQERFGGDWVVWTRVHLATLSGKGCPNFFDSKCVDMSSICDMQELLCAADVLITDYSSSIWDFSLTKRPVFLYVPDLDMYRDNDRGFYYPIDEWGFPYAETNAELDVLIRKFDLDEYIESVANHHKVMGNCESGHATECVVDFIVNG